VDVNILKPDTGYLSVIERPNPPSATYSPRSSRGHTTSSDGGSSPAPGYTEPLSEGEDDEYDGVLAPARDEGKRTGLSGDEVNAAIAYRQQMLKEQREEAEAGGSRTSSHGKARDTSGDLSSNVSEAGDDSQSESPRRPKYRRGKSSGIGKKLKTRSLQINPLAPSSEFDETLKTKLDQAKEQAAERAKSSGLPPDVAEEETALGEPSRVAEDRILDRNWHAPEGKKIAVPVRIEPKVYFAAERTFLVSPWFWPFSTQTSFVLFILSVSLLHMRPLNCSRGGVFFIPSATRWIHLILHDARIVPPRLLTAEISLGRIICLASLPLRALLLCSIPSTPFGHLPAASHPLVEWNMRR